MNFEENIALAPYTTFRIGGPARWFAEAASEEDLIAGLEFARSRGLPVFVLGGGSNLLVSDGGFPGLVLHVALKGIEQSPSGGRARFTAAAGEDWDQFVATTVAEDCAGVECLSGIPGTVGGTPVQNVGAYGQEVSETIERVRVLDREGLRLLDLDNGQCGFGYRRSVLNSTMAGRYIVTEVEFSLVPHGQPTIRYEDVRRALGEKSDTATLPATRSAVRAIRERKGMLIGKNGDSVPDNRSAGSFFRNPVISAAQFERLVRAVDTDPALIPHYPASDGQVKVAAAWLLERAGFSKGYAMGHAAISRRHALALVNLEDDRGQGATAEEILALRDRITSAVEERFGVHLAMEPVWVS